MKDIITEMIEKAIYYEENMNCPDEARDLLLFARNLIDEMSITTINVQAWEFED